MEILVISGKGTRPVGLTRLAKEDRAINEALWKMKRRFMVFLVLLPILLAGLWFGFG
jgi:hypothetical protein